MKQKWLVIRLACALVLGAAVVTIPTSCTTSQQRVTYNTLYSVENSVLTSYDAYLDMLITGEVKTNDAPKVALAFNRFQAGMQAAVSAAQFNYSNATPASVMALANEVLLAIVKAKEMK